MNNENLNATLRCVTRPSAAQEEKIKTFLKNKYLAHNITLNILIDPSVRGGFILSANNDEYDCLHVLVNNSFKNKFRLPGIKPFK